MKTVTYEQFLNFGPCWLETEEGRKRLMEYRKWWGAGKTALDILLLEEVDAADKLWVVLRSEFIEDNILHEFACCCAERALCHIDNPDQRSIAAIKAKRAWLNGEISDEELENAEKDALSAAEYAAQSAGWMTSKSETQYATLSAALVAKQSASSSAAQDAALSAALAAARNEARTTAYHAAQAAAWDIAWIAPYDGAWVAVPAAGHPKERQWQVNHLKELLSSDNITTNYFNIS